MIGTQAPSLSRKQKLAKKIHSTIFHQTALARFEPGNTKGGSITVPLISCSTGLKSAVRQLTIIVFICINRVIQTSQTGGRLYSDTSPFSIPCSIPRTWDHWTTVLPTALPPLGTCQKKTQSGQKHSSLSHRRINDEGKKGLAIVVSSP